MPNRTAESTQNRTPKCRHCDRPSPVAQLCAHCIRTLRVGLRNVAALHADLDTTVRAGATRYTDPSPVRAHTTTSRLPFDARFAPIRRTDAHGILQAPEQRSNLDDTDHHVRNTLATWARVVLDDHPPLRRPMLIVCTDPTCRRCIPYALEDYPAQMQAYRRRAAPRDTVTSMAVYLFRMAGAVASAEYADELLRDVLALERRLRRLVDRPGESWYAGVCGAIVEDERPHDARSCACQCHAGLGIACDVPGGCGREHATIDAVLCSRPLWADADDHEVRCRDCGTTWDVEDRREIVLSEARERVATVDAIWRIVHQHVDDSIGYTRFAARVRTWRNRGLTRVEDGQRVRYVLRDHGTRVVDGQQVRAYLVGDVLDFLAVSEELRDAS